MSDTYNPDEIVKLKHLNEFASQLNHKLDGDTSLTTRTPDIGVLGTVYQLNGTPIRVGFSQLVWDSSQQFFSISISVPTGLTNNKQPNVTPTIINTTSTNPNVTFKVWSITWYHNNINKWYFTSGVTGANSSDKQETTLTFQFQIPQGDGFEAYLSPVITIEVYDNTV